MIWRCFLVIAFSFCSACGMSHEARNTFQNALIGEDYDILNERDLVLLPNGNPSNIPFSGSRENFGFRYWQCFPREKIALIYEDTGYSPEEMRNTDTMADISIRVTVEPGVFHEYVARRLMPPDEFERRLLLWRRLLKSERFACIEGDFGQRNYKILENGQKHEVYTWTFEKIKTKKGCDSYFDFCSQ